MHDKYGKETIKFMRQWCDEMGFPNGGSFGLKAIASLEEQLNKKEKKLRKGKKVLVRDLKDMEQLPFSMHLMHGKWKLNVGTENKHVNCCLMCV